MGNGFFPHGGILSLKILDFLVVIALVLVWYALVPGLGAVYSRVKWRQFRERFDSLRLRPLLDYTMYRNLSGHVGEFRFAGAFESITDRRTLWIKGDTLTISVSLKDAQTWLLPMQEGEGVSEVFDPGEEAPERIRWDRIATFTEGAKVFVGGGVRLQNGCWSFMSNRKTPLLIIFYDCPDRFLTPRIIRSSRHRNEYWNAVTPYSLIMGALSLLLLAASFLDRPAFRLTVITALAAVFVPVFPLIPPGLIFTVFYRRLAWRARIFRACRDLAKLPLRHLGKGRESGKLPNGESYGIVSYKTPHRIRKEKIPFLIPDAFIKTDGGDWYVFGALSPGRGLPAEPADPLASFGALPGRPEQIFRYYKVNAFILETAAWLALFLGVSLNAFFISMILIAF
jgi:hypothetical protein